MSSLIAWYRGGGPTMPFLACAAVVGFLAVLDRAYSILARGHPNGRHFIERTIQLVRGGNVDEAIKLCTRSHAALPDLGLLILRNNGCAGPDLQRIATSAVQSLVPRLRRRALYVPTTAAVALLAGVLGLALGLQYAFDAAAEAQLAGGASSILPGLSLALRPLVFALAIAIPLYAAQAVLTTLAEQVVDQVDELSIRLVDALLDRPDVRLGHRG